MRLLWMKSNLPLSLSIRAILGEDCSHFAFAFDKVAPGLVYESNLLGCHPTFLKTMLTGFGAATIVHSIDVPISEQEELFIFNQIIEKYDGKPYDFGGALYLGYRTILMRLFGIEKPNVNKWSTGGYFCDELYEILMSLPKFPKIEIMNGMDTPHDVWNHLKDWSLTC